VYIAQHAFNGFLYPRGRVASTTTHDYRLGTQLRASW